MSRKIWGHTKVLQKYKAKLISILSANADFALQHAHSAFLLSPEGYIDINECHIPSEKVRTLLDHVIFKEPKAACKFLELLKTEELQTTFPMLDFLKEIQVDVQSSEKEPSRKRKTAMDVKDVIPPKQACKSGSHLVTEKQLIKVASVTGETWRQIGIMVLGVPAVKLEQIRTDRSTHVDRVFKMLCYWRNRQKDKATAANLHSLLSDGDLALPSESIDFLLETEEST